MRRRWETEGRSASRRCDGSVRRVPSFVSGSPGESLRLRVRLGGSDPEEGSEEGRSRRKGTAGERIPESGRATRRHPLSLGRSKTTFDIIFFSRFHCPLFAKRFRRTVICSKLVVIKCKHSTGR